MTAHLRSGLQARLTPLHAPDPPLTDWPGYRAAAILVPVFEGERGLELLFTVRSAELPSHAGQISFPGGGARRGEALMSAALREAREEVGLEVPEGALLGRLGERPSPAKYLATPFVAWLPRPEALTIDPREVQEAFTVPLEDLLACEPELEERLLQGRPQRIVHYRVAERHIWGLTGTVLHELIALLKAREVMA